MRERVQYAAWWAAVLVEASSLCARDLAEYVAMRARSVRRRVR